MIARTYRSKYDTEGERDIIPQNRGCQSFYFGYLTTRYTSIYSFYPIRIKIRAVEPGKNHNFLISNPRLESPLKYLIL